LFRRVTSQREKPRDFDAARGKTRVQTRIGTGTWTSKGKSVKKDIGIMNYLHVLCIIFMVLSCVLYMTLMMFIYVYYGLFVCTNLVDVMSLFFTGFSFHLSIFNKNQPVFDKNWPEIATLIF
jgi:hypothetical protein